MTEALATNFEAAFRAASDRYATDGDPVRLGVPQYPFQGRPTPGIGSRETSGSNPGPGPAPLRANRTMRSPGGSGPNRRFHDVSLVEAAGRESMFARWTRYDTGTRSVEMAYFAHQ